MADGAGPAVTEAELRKFTTAFYSDLGDGLITMVRPSSGRHVIIDSPRGSRTHCPSSLSFSNPPSSLVVPFECGPA